MNNNLVKEKETLLRIREQEFKDQVMSFKEYSEQMLNQFFDYWTEPDKHFNMRFEKQKTWETRRRLARWYNNQKIWRNAGSKASAASDFLSEAKEYVTRVATG